MSIMITILAVLLAVAVFNPFRDDWGKVSDTAHRKYGRGYMTPKEYDEYSKSGENVAWLVIAIFLLLLVFVVGGAV